ncbi:MULTISPECIES: hypothetical protein [unclassified Mesorhizobium]|uniref:hypothetical protein n=1 Tax=unclassified Mesorhizobium TaxID=325217 RepID=UPI0015E41F33|nr:MULTISPECIES: hypothetical protein [unclassified Mesorhizobium]MBZ9946511.1 hypothetical protein [Mesorhizobium sp. BR1-1-11]MBZ9700575.1 hypothetical protein [Mesorhizobium sp. CO1-1-3]MBZ9958181.1 hypothetical protein [Mesorhizobium sp. BR1-1-14]MCA0001002.1 hypothetical protein [Mesorhizobium sp. B264B2A]MCA0004751.1 hypothetical protein [Mesorhizobium sp. B264B1B]
MIQLLEIFGDVMRIATYQWRDERTRRKHHEEQSSPRRWALPADRQPLRRFRP